jgi:hypothetical protein
MYHKLDWGNMGPTWPIRRRQRSPTPDAVGRGCLDVFETGDELRMSTCFAMMGGTQLPTAQNGIVFDSLEEVILGVPEIALNFDS